MVSTTASPTVSQQSRFAETSVGNEAHSSGVSWAAVIAGAFVAAALSLILLALGTGLGLSSVSPWSNSGASASAVGTAAILWLIVMQIIASAMGGYLAGRLRTKWASIHSDEVYFRDTAHGFLAWAVAIVLTAAFLASAAASMMGGASEFGTRASANAEPGMATGSQAEGRAGGPNAYFVDTLFRSDPNAPNRSDPAVRGEAGRIFVRVLREGEDPAVDKTYLAQLVAAKTGLSQAEAEKRLSDTLTQAKEVADTARKAAAHLSLWVFLALLIGAFCASFAATIGGRQRDHVVIL
jgi:hypothetical protein